jgi:hypothetical protein
MNTIQAQTAVAPSSNTGKADVASPSSNISTLSIKSVTGKDDHYSASAANDIVIARVITSSIGKSFNFNRAESNELTAATAAKLNERFWPHSPNEDTLPNIKSVTNNVVSFVESALSNLASRGFNKEQLSFFKSEAKIGVEVGIDQAKLDLIGFASDDILTTIDNTKHSILDGIKQLSVEPQDYPSKVKVSGTSTQGTNPEFAAVRINTLDKKVVKLDFDMQAFQSSSFESEKSIYTTSSSNISFAVNGNIEQSRHQSIANLINKIDGLANSFYRTNVEDAFSQSLELGYTGKDILALASQLNQKDNVQQIKMYEDIEHLSPFKQHANLAAPKAVAQYVNKYLDVLESSQSTLHDQKDFNQVIVGLVNQMKDVQVPDLLQAINRFHAFNKQFA